MQPKVGTFEVRKKKDLYEKKIQGMLAQKQVDPGWDRGMLAQKGVDPGWDRGMLAQKQVAAKMIQGMLA